jgi:hypothetical protein
MTNILTAAEAALVLRTEIADPVMLQYLPLTDAYIKNASGRDWTADTTIEPIAKAAAQILLVQWYENPAMLGQGLATLGAGLTACLLQLEAKALELESSGVPEETLAIAASLPVDGARNIAITASLVLIFNHAMDAGATSAVALKTAAGGGVTSTNSLDITSKILTINPTASLTAATQYKLVITAAADAYGQTLTQDIWFTTA